MCIPCSDTVVLQMTGLLQEQNLRLNSEGNKRYTILQSERVRVAAIQELFDNIYDEAWEILVAQKRDNMGNLQVALLPKRILEK